MTELWRHVSSNDSRGACPEVNTWEAEWAMVPMLTDPDSEIGRVGAERPVVVGDFGGRVIRAKRASNLFYAPNKALGGER
jgi:hypothetical protein